MSDPDVRAMSPTTFADVNVAAAGPPSSLNVSITVRLVH